MILYRRSTLYVHGLLFFVLAVGAFGAGYFVGRGNQDRQGGWTASNPGPRPPGSRPASERVLVSGKLYYHTGAGRIAPDAGAVILALPADRSPETTLTIEDLRPGDRPPTEASKGVGQIEAFGGLYARADADGAFGIVFPREGAYRLLLISRNTTRPEDLNVDELDLTEIKRYFFRAADLIGPHKYRWTVERIETGFPPIEHGFGRDGEEDGFGGLTARDLPQHATR